MALAALRTHIASLHDDAPCLFCARVTQETLVHSSVGTTLSQYSHVGQTMQKEAADQVDALLSGVVREA
jgi:hypothetical protein